MLWAKVSLQISASVSSADDWHAFPCYCDQRLPIHISSALLTAVCALCRPQPQLPHKGKLVVHLAVRSLHAVLGIYYQLEGALYCAITGQPAPACFGSCRCLFLIACAHAVCFVARAPAVPVLQSSPCLEPSPCSCCSAGGCLRESTGCCSKRRVRGPASER